MLDSDTKRRIDSCRDILVGKVPDPKSQVEQITIALIYKFMDDMDAESEELGGTRKFFTGEFGKYGWPKLMAPNMGGFDVLALYSEAIQKMNENPGVPGLFRDIFKNAYLPYRDPETLRSFLKEIDSFTYDHSERLGDAFEYLLSVLGSQGDAGQFRTPRHIIDFMVEIIDPKKGESILDPACGTAGFLISSYKHILKHNSTDYNPQNDLEAYDEKGVPLEAVTLDSPLHYKGDKLTPDDRKRLADNIKGYDISPDMVRLSLVNMYLHGFTDPHIIEYDTLTSDERWNDYADIILANPPFMSPKGGIKPHKRFSVQAKRSEVLFVDYMAEHLTPTGRAAIIVPEGIIFQSGSAYKQLREMLVKNYLVAVVSLPAGVFNPYSGVKTSIIILDKRLSKKTDNILFAKIENDGFNLGAQRRAIDKNDLPDAARNIKAWLDNLRKDRVLLLDGIPNLYLVEKARIAENGEWNLSVERYRDYAPTQSSWPMIEIREVARVDSGFGFPLDYQGTTDKLYPFLKVSDMNLPGNEIYITTQNNTVDADVLAHIKAKTFPAGTVIFPKIGAAIATNKKRILAKESAFDNNVMGLVPDTSRLVPEFLFFLLLPFDLSRWASDAQPPSMRKSTVEEHLIPLPPMDVQNEIVAEIDRYQKIIDGARQVVENYQPRIHVEPDWPLVDLGTLCVIGGSITTEVDLSLPYIGADSLESHTGRLLQLKSALDQSVSGPVYNFNGKRILYSKIRPYLNKLAIIDFTGYCSSDMYPLLVDESMVIPVYLSNFMLSMKFNESIKGLYERASIPKINRAQLFSVKIPLPDLETQRAIVAQIEEE